MAYGEGSRARAKQPGGATWHDVVRLGLSSSYTITNVIMGARSRCSNHFLKSLPLTHHRHKNLG